MQRIDNVMALFNNQEGFIQGSILFGEHNRVQWNPFGNKSTRFLDIRIDCILLRRRGLRDGEHVLLLEYKTAPAGTDKRTVYLNFGTSEQHISLFIARTNPHTVSSPTPAPAAQRQASAGYNSQGLEGGIPGETDSPCSEEAAKARAFLLARDEELKALHRDLVRRGVVSEAQFWSEREELVASAMAGPS